MSVLLIDAGNTRIEWRYVQADEIYEGQAFYNDIPQQWPSAERVVVATVAQQAKLAMRLESSLEQPIEWLTQPLLTFPHFKHCYPKPERLGVDRWLAMLGARLRSSAPLMVVDAGTALTIDFLAPDNQHVGGYIVPGLIMAQQALYQNTEKVRPYDDEQPSLQRGLGTNTQECVRAGVQQQQVALIQMLRQQYPEYQLVITGGDGQWLAQQTDAECCRNLVLDGMEFLCAGYF